MIQNVPWCLFEICCTVVTNSLFNMVMSTNVFLVDMEDGKSDETLKMIVSSINVLKKRVFRTRRR
jgi:hypothetical protein